MQSSNRRDLLKGGVIAGISAISASTLFGLRSFGAVKSTNIETDITILNAALDLEHQGIWAYDTAAPKLSSTTVGKTILALALRNRADHIEHRNILASTVKKLGGTPVKAKDKYDLSSYIDAREGNLDTDANIAKLALALEVDAALAYNDAFAKLKDAGLIAAAATIGPNEIAHATAIRAVFRSLNSSIEYVPAGFVSADTRSQWILKV